MKNDSEINQQNQSMEITKIYREYGKTVFVEIPGKRGSISAKSGIEAAIYSAADRFAAQKALQTLVEIEVEAVLNNKLAALGVIN